MHPCVQLKASVHVCEPSLQVQIVCTTLVSVRATAGARGL